MQVTETLKDGLKREFRVQVTSADLAARAATRLEELKGQVNLNGFRKGKVPTAHLKRLYGRSVMAECVEAIIGEANGKICEDNGIRFAGTPQPKLPEEESEALKVFDGHADLDYTVSFEILPEIPVSDFSNISVEKLVTDVEQSEIDDALANLAKSNRTYDAKDGAADKDDALMIDFKGSIDGDYFEGGSAENIRLVIGSGSFIPGFEEQCEGMKAGEERDITVTFPADYGAANLAGKTAKFEIKAHAVEKPVDRAIDNELATMVGFEDLEKLTDAIKAKLGGDYAAASRAKVKRALLDALDKNTSFELPQGLVTQEFDNVWTQVTSDLQSNNKTFADEDTTEEKAREEYKAISERRVRLGLLLAEVGEKANIQVTEEEVTRAVIEQTRQFPGQEKMIYDFYRKNPDMVQRLRAPIFEEKAVDHILTLVKVTEKKVSKEELLKQDEE